MLNTKNSKQLKRITTVMRQSVFIREKQISCEIRETYDGKS